MVKEINSKSFESEVVNYNGIVIVDFWAPWCGPCKMMGPIFDKLSNEFDGKIKFVKLNVDLSGETAAKYGIMGIPALVVFNGEKEVTRIVGYNPEDVLRTKIAEMLN